jgi:ribosomal protein S18 acetylase RimI-like enzyme
MGSAREQATTSERISVRAASAADRATAMTLIAPGTPRGQVSLALMRAGQGLLWVAVEGEGEREQLVGLLLATIQVAAEGDELVGYIQELLVHPAYRRLGVAGHLLDAAEPYFIEEHGLDRIELATSPDNDAALRLYRSRGYTIHQVRISKASVKTAAKRRGKTSGMEEQGSV